VSVFQFNFTSPNFANQANPNIQQDKRRLKRNRGKQKGGDIFEIMQRDIKSVTHKSM